jgi:hypothetical protein
MGGGSSPRPLWSFPPTATFTSFPAPDYSAVLLLLPAAVFVYSSCGRWVFPPLLWSFPPCHSHKLFHSWLLGACLAPTGASPACPASLSTVPGRIPFPQSSVLSAPHPLSHVFIVLIAYYSVSLFSRVEVGLSRGLCCSGLGCLWEYRGTTKLTLSAYSQAV